MTYGLYMPVYGGPGVSAAKGRGDYGMRIELSPEHEQHLARAENRAIIIGVGTGFIVTGATAAAIYLFGLLVTSIEHYFARSRPGPSS